MRKSMRNQGDAKLLSHIQGACAYLAVMALCAVLFAVPASANGLTAAEAAGLNLGIDANYVFVDLGSTTLGWNSGPEAGSVLFGLGLNAMLSGGNNGGLSNGGEIFYDSSVTLSGTLQNQPPTVLVPTSTTMTALTDAQNVAAYAKGLLATQTFADITTATTITGNGGLNVIDVANIHNAPLTLKGTSSDFFVINVSGSLQTNVAMTLNGVSASNVLFNFTGTSGNVFQTSGGDTLYGTFLSVYGGEYGFSNLNLDGELINTDGNVQLVSGSSIPTFSPFTPMSAPEPGVLLLLCAGLLGLGVMVYRNRTGFVALA